MVSETFDLHQTCKKNLQNTECVSYLSLFCWYSASQLATVNTIIFYGNVTQLATHAMKVKLTEFFKKPLIYLILYLIALSQLTSTLYAYLLHVKLTRQQYFIFFAQLMHNITLVSYQSFSAIKEYFYLIFMCAQHVTIWMISADKNQLNYYNTGK